ncbi:MULTISPECIES: hypothetical protein [Acidithiobacillaceae]|nr:MULTISPECIES: hypothetical protein [Acidithiobacillaceae]MBU2764447.1 hypothetical protein [Acidithiobacillus caldus]MBU2771164.1 hypothetical protein [Acidithiobacillus caldus]
MKRKTALPNTLYGAGSVLSLEPAPTRNRRHRVYHEPKSVESALAIDWMGIGESLRVAMSEYQDIHAGG